VEVKSIGYFADILVAKERRARPINRGEIGRPDHAHGDGNPIPTKHINYVRGAAAEGMNKQGAQGIGSDLVVVETWTQDRDCPWAFPKRPR
jgi:hypothetical protein